MTVYLAGQFARQLEFQSYRNDLYDLGWHTTSSWLDEDPEHENDIRYAEQDLRDIDSADAIIFFAGPPYFGTLEEIARGGRHFEMGYAFASGKMIIVIGKPEGDFQRLPTITHFDSWDGFLTYVTI